jgi:hypothetical protein
MSDRLIDRLRGKYRVGPDIPGDPEFGYRNFDMPPICGEAADEIERLQAELADVTKDLERAFQVLESRSSTT